MGSLNDFWNTSKRANDFLRTGIINDTVRNAGSNSYSASGSDLSSGSGCVSTSECPSGWGCVNGVCQQLNNSGSGSSGPSQGNSPSSGGPCDPEDPQSPCNSGGPNSCQQTAQCGDQSGEARDCCGTRHCSFGSASSSAPGVNCSCGERPSLSGCTSFCDSYLKSNGGVGPGCSEGPTGNSCDSCTECDGNIGGECDDISIGADCYCSGGGCNADNCETCDTGTGSGGFGGCAISDGCQECGTITNHLCPCGIALAPITVCQTVGTTGLTTINQAQQQAAAQCDAACNKNNAPDPCKPKISNTTRCTDTGAGVAECPAGSTQKGSLEAGGESCVFCETADYSNLPGSCKECDCNCNNDCSDCQLCGSDGTCQADPKCEEPQECPTGYEINPLTGECEQRPASKLVITYSVVVRGYCAAVGPNDYMIRQRLSSLGAINAGETAVYRMSQTGSSDLTGQNGEVFTQFRYAGTLTVTDEDGTVLYELAQTATTAGGAPSLTYVNSFTGTQCFPFTDACCDTVPANLCPGTVCLDAL